MLCAPSRENGLKYSANVLKRTQKGLKIGSKRPQNDANPMPKLSPKDPKVTPDRPQNGPKIHPKWPCTAPDRVKNGSKTIKQGQK